MVVAISMFIGFMLGGFTEYFTPWLESYLSVSAAVIFGVGIVIVEGPTLITAIVLARKVTRMWVRSALQATGPFVGFFAFVVAYGVLRHPLFAFPF
jgi:hypothetical protein